MMEVIEGQNKPPRPYIGITGRGKSVQVWYCYPENGCSEDAYHRMTSALGEANLLVQHGFAAGQVKMKHQRPVGVAEAREFAKKIAAITGLEIREGKSAWPTTTPTQPQMELVRSES